MSVTHDRVASSTTSKGITPSSSLVQAHAPNQLPPPDFVLSHLFPLAFCRLLRAPAGNCFFPTLFRKSFPGCLSHDPVGGQSAYACYFPYLIGLPHLHPIGSASPNLSAKRLHAGLVSRSSLFLTFRPPVLLATQVSPAAAAFQSSQDSRDFYTRADHASLPLHALGMLAV